MEQTIKPKQKWLSALLAALPLAMLFMSCDLNGMYKTTDFKLHGTWKSTSADSYSGKLVIAGDTITITGYDESQTLQGWNSWNDARRPFKDFAKGVPLACYSDEGKLFITTVEGEKIVPYLYSSNSQGKFLSFAFGGRGEGLKRTGN